MESLELAFSSEVVVGWRAWRFRWVDGVGFALTSVSPMGTRPLDAAGDEASLITFDPYPYPTRLAAEASCQRTRDPNHFAPADGCHCGFYAVPKEKIDVIDKFLPWPQEPPYQPNWMRLDRVLGTVSLWGEVLECEEGWRSQYAYPKEVFVPSGCRTGGWVGDEIVSLDAAAIADQIGRLYEVPAQVLDEQAIRSLLSIRYR